MSSACGEFDDAPSDPILFRCFQRETGGARFQSPTGNHPVSVVSKLLRSCRARAIRGSSFRSVIELLQLQHVMRIRACHRPLPFAVGNARLFVFLSRLGVSVPVPLAHGHGAGSGTGSGDRGLHRLRQKCGDGRQSTVREYVANICLTVS